MVIFWEGLYLEYQADVKWEGEAIEMMLLPIIRTERILVV